MIRLTDFAIGVSLIVCVLKLNGFRGLCGGPAVTSLPMEGLLPTEGGARESIG